MSNSKDLVVVLKTELKQAGITYAALARSLGMAESSVKRMFAKADMPLARVDDICRELRLDFAELARQVAAMQPLRSELTLEQETAVVANPRLLLIAICALSQWSLEQIVATYRIEESEATGMLVRLDRLGIIELRPMNRYRVNLAKTFRWRPNGPVMNYFRSTVIGDYYAGGFDGEDEVLMLVHGEIGASQAQSFVERLQRLGQDFAAQHQSDHRLPSGKKRAYTLVLGMRSWLFAPFRDMQRADKRGGSLASAPAGKGRRSSAG